MAMDGERSALSTALGCAAAAALAGYLFFHRNELASLRCAAYWPLALAVFGSALILLADGALNFVMLRRLAVPVGWRECVSLSCVATAWNLLTPARGGAAFRAVYLKKVHSLGYRLFLSTLLGFYVLTTLILCSAALGALVWLRTIEHRGNTTTLEWTAAVCLLGCVLAAWLPATGWENYWLLRRIGAITQGWQVLRSEPRTVLSLLCVASLQMAAGLLALWACYRALGIRLGAIEVTAVGTLGAMSTLLSITPGSLGVYEAVVAFVANTLGVEPVHSVAAATISRLVLVVLLLPLASIGTYHLTRLARRTSTNSPHRDARPARS